MSAPLTARSVSAVGATGATARTPRKRGSSRPRTATAKKKERDFNLSSGPATIPEYNPLQDVHLTHFFRSRVVQRQLIETGLVRGRLRAAWCLQRTSGRLMGERVHGWMCAWAGR